MPINNADIFKCSEHDFSTSVLAEWDKHCLEEEHGYDLHTPCAGKCGKTIHIEPHVKLDPSARRIPRGYMCDDCKKKVEDAKEIKEAGEIAREKKEN